VALLALQVGRSPAWRQELDRYVQRQDALSSGTTTVRFTVRASKPWNLTPEMSSAVYGDSPHYRTDYGYGTEYGTVKDRSGPRALPYPPENVWCALLEWEGQGTGEPGRETRHTVVFVAKHQDLYNADLMVHEAATDLSTQALAEYLSRLGCESLLQQVESDQP
ncbi:MAG: hypothetical protein JSV36_04540, partial [Anaerolineae bacterium]